jgi:hypothetical protein
MNDRDRQLLFRPRPATVSLLTPEQYESLRRRVAKIENAKLPGFRRQWYQRIGKAVR